MIKSFRSALMVVAALSASQVAPAQVTSEAEALIANGTGVIPANVVLEPISPSADLPQNYVDPLAPAPEPETMVEPAAGPRANSRARSLAGRHGRRSCAAASRAAASSNASPAAIYFESKSEPLAGQLAVGQVIANRAASRAASRRPIAAWCSSAASSASFAAVAAAESRARAASGRMRSPSPRSSTRSCTTAGRQGAVLPRPPGLAGLAPDARRDASATTSSTARSRFHAVPRFCSSCGRWPPRSTLNSRLFRRSAADRGRGRARGDAAVLPPATCSRCAKCRCPTAAAPT